MVSLGDVLEHRLLAPAALWFLSLADLLLTLSLLDIGATEVNPIADYLLSQSTAAAVVWKVGSMSIYCLGLYLFWEHRLARYATWSLVVLYAMLVAYELLLFGGR